LGVLRDFILKRKGVGAISDVAADRAKNKTFGAESKGRVSEKRKAKKEIY